mmetsp:Transcript_9966/g.21941  ORF Transcript_9966/g.21941 Transcript_9966/m.21941 type:complete len:211 (-) Transcript_9966:47-679(-)
MVFPQSTRSFLVCRQVCRHEITSHSQIVSHNGGIRTLVSSRSQLRSRLARTIRSSAQLSHQLSAALLDGDDSIAELIHQLLLALEPLDSAEAKGNGLSHLGNHAQLTHSAVKLTLECVQILLILRHPGCHCLQSGMQLTAVTVVSILPQAQIFKVPPPPLLRLAQLSLQELALFGTLGMFCGISCLLLLDSCHLLTRQGHLLLNRVELLP